MEQVSGVGGQGAETQGLHLGDFQQRSTTKNKGAKFCAPKITVKTSSGL